MKTKPSFIAIALILSFSFSASFSQDQNKTALKAKAGIMTGYNRGFGMQGNITVSEFAGDFPFELRLALGYTFLNPGNAADARQVFINNATNGQPEKNGGSFDIRLDFLKAGSVFGIQKSYVVFGPRFSTFKGHFDYVGGNEVFDVTSHQWGIGAGLEHHFAMSQNIALVFRYGLDFYFPSTLTGHDTSYSPDNDNVNPETDNNDHVFQYKDANKAIYQPGFMPYAMLGIHFQL